MPARLFLVLIPILMISYFPTFSSTAGATLTNSRQAASKAADKDDGEKKQPWLKNESRHAKKSAPLMEEEYLVSEIDQEEDIIIDNALSLLGAKYRFGGSGYSGIDCSAFVKKVFSSLNQLPRTAREQSLIGKGVPLEKLERGDLLFFHTYADFPSHVGIYLGNGRMIHASSAGGRVMISSIDTPYFRARYIGARRIPLEGFLTELMEEV